MRVLHRTLLLCAFLLLIGYNQVAQAQGMVKKILSLLVDYFAPSPDDIAKGLYVITGKELEGNYEMGTPKNHECSTPYLPRARTVLVQVQKNNPLTLIAIERYKDTNTITGYREVLTQRADFNFAVVYRTENKILAENLIGGVVLKKGTLIPLIYWSENDPNSTPTCLVKLPEPYLH
jgi:hypothetical protein